MSTPIISAVNRLSDETAQTRADYAKNFAELRDRIEQVESKADRPRAGGRASSVEMTALQDFVRTGRGLDMTETKSMSMATAADGGGLVPELIADSIIDKALAQGGLARQVRRTQTPTSDYVRLVNLRGQAAVWISEAGTRSATANLQLREVRPPSGELYSAVTVSNWLLNDAQFNVDRMVLDNATAQFARALETAVYSGSGSSAPEGIVHVAPVATTDAASPQRAANAIEKVVGSTDIGNSLIDAFFKLRPEYRRNASWVMSSSTLATVRKLRDSNGSGYLWQSNLGQGVDASDGTLLGKSVFTCEDVSSYGDGSPMVNAVLVGDFLAAYELLEIGPMTIIRDPFSTRGWTTIYIAQRFGGRLTDNDSIKVLAI